jgi:hypothetical protein
MGISPISLSISSNKVGQPHTTSTRANEFPHEPGDPGPFDPLLRRIHVAPHPFLRIHPLTFHIQQHTNNETPSPFVKTPHKHHQWPPRPAIPTSTHFAAGFMEKLRAGEKLDFE